MNFYQVVFSFWKALAIISLLIKYKFTSNLLSYLFGVDINNKKSLDKIY